MDASEATKIVMSRIQSLDPENASRIIGFILIQDQGEQEMIRLAFGPDALLLSYVNQAKPFLANALRQSNFFPQNPPPILVPNDGFHSSDLSSPSSFPIMSPGGRSDSLSFRDGEDANTAPLPHPFHRRSYSVNDAVFLSNLEEGGIGCRPCMYGFCNNGSACKFLHGDDAVEVGSPSPNDEFFRMKALQQRRYALMVSGGRHRFSFLDENQRLSRRGPRNEFASMMLGAAMASSSQQIYLTFPSDSTFKEEDVSNYFRMFGPVQDVRIPYQQRRMFGFVTFLYPETVKLVLAKGNPHYVCDSRVLVKPYKEKAKVPDKKQLQPHHQNLERGEHSSCLSPSGIDSEELVDRPIGPRMFSSTQEMMMRRRSLEHEAELQHTIEAQGQRLTNLQLMEMKYQQQNGFPTGISISCPRRSQLLMGESVIASSDAGHKDVLQDIDNGQETPKSTIVAADEKSSLERSLPDNLFSSPTKLAGDHQ